MGHLSAHHRSAHSRTAHVPELTTPNKGPALSPRQRKQWYKLL